ncbi:family 16 glycosylhydrolase [uncultured Algibacter sp.]|uniref:family 16 glycosylhydrolase n=1 Tax=uncultured Algibacter sp. TaxID=298659 RepID=UPI0026030F0C|nr:family 16 glycosylhydrolase [uncultured Algibacter sp.]
MPKNTLHYIATMLLVSLFCFSQQTPIDFSSNSHNFSSWGGSTFIILPGPVDSNNDTGQFFRSSSALEQGNYIDLSRSIDLDTEDEITLRFHSFDTNPHDVIVKLENGTNPDVEVLVTAPSNQNAWSDLTFDFSTVGGTGQYSRLTIRIDDGSTIPGAFRIDDINDGNIATDPNALDVIYSDLVWSDEFNTPGKTPVDNSKWHHQTFGPNGGRWFNGEEQHYTNSLDNSFVENGFLNIVAKKEEGFEQNGVILDYTSARLNSKLAFTHGRVDVRAKLPFGNGTWPAIWTLGKNINETGAYWQTQGFGTTSWPACGEIDIMEHGLGATNHTSSAIHTPSSSGNTVNTESQVLNDVANNFYVYSVNWSPNQITFMVDGIGYYTYNPAVKDASTWPFNLEQYLILNVAMGGISGTIDSGFTESAMIIDYVRVYQNNALSVDSNSINNINFYPNPTSDTLHVQTHLNLDKILIFDMLGKKIVTKVDPKKSIDVSELQPGLYILKAYSGEQNIITKRIIIE